jgi:methylmalonyl-CoA/ethylmalonyl-CoA epimerase
MWTFDHIGIVVSDLKTGSKKLLSTLPVTMVSQRFDDEVLGVSVKFFKDGCGQVFELIAPLGVKSPVAKLAAGKHGKIDQLCYRCSDLTAATETLRKGNSVPLGKALPAMAFGGSKVQFFWTPNEFVLELVEGEGDARSYVNCR